MLNIAAIIITTALVPEQQVHATAYGCDFTGATSVSILVQNDVLFPHNRRVIVPATISSDGLLHFDFALPPGSFDIEYWVKDLPCNFGGGGIAILPGHDRHVVLPFFQGSEQGPNGSKALGIIRDWHNRKFFAGSLPVTGLGISIVVSESVDCPHSDKPQYEYPAVFDGAAYYVGYVSIIGGKHAFLKIFNEFNTAYFALPDPKWENYNDQYVVRDVTLDDLKLLAEPAIGAECVSAPSGTSVPFAGIGPDE
ncbi:MAG: hypothetical protein JO347_03875 [Candidatus Eremiobacteraeota bacterium]|nr:hypothetical protein [Candidatus Eremiobacteraeota bacterium]